MRKFNKIFLSLILLVGLFAMSGCSSDDESTDATIVTQAITEDGYRIAIPFKSSDMTKVHVDYNRGYYDIEAVGKGLQRYAKEYYKTSDYYLQDGQLLTRDNTVSSTNTERLLGRKSGDNPFGLNPENGSSLPISNSQSIIVGNSTIPIVDVFEYDFITDLSENADIEGLAFGIVLTSTVTDADGNTHTINDDQLRIIGEEAGRNLLTFIKDMPEVSNNTPIMIALYNNNSEDSNLGGTFFAVGYGRSSIDSFQSVNEQWAIIPSDSASDLDAQLVSQFNSVKNALFKFLPNDIGMIGKGFFIDNQIYELQLTITTQGKTYVQNAALVQYVNELLSNFSGDSYSITVKVNANTETFAMLHRERGSSSVTAIMN